MPIKQRILNLSLALDQFLFCLICLGHSYPGESASACAWRLDKEGRWQGKILRRFIDKILWFDPDHCRVAFENLKAQMWVAPEEKKETNG